MFFFTRSLRVFFFFTDTATTDIYTLSLHDALPISDGPRSRHPGGVRGAQGTRSRTLHVYRRAAFRSEEHTSELQSHSDLVCRLLLEKKKKTYGIRTIVTIHKDRVALKRIEHGHAND